MAAPYQDRVAWEPQSGPQTLLVQCPAEECFYGGAVGGGKTDGLLGDFSRGIEYGSKWVGLFLRRFTPDMSYVIRRAQEIFCPVYGSTIWKESKHEFQFPTGAILQFRAADRDADALKHQGQQYCVAKGTPVVMGDGSTKPIEDIVAGDMVQTLDGPHAVLATHDVGKKPCVIAIFRDDDGFIIGTQAHPEDHPIMNASGGWDSYASLASGPSGCEGYCDCSQESQPPQALTFRAALRARDLRQDTVLGASSILSRAPGRSPEPSLATSQDLSGSCSGRSPQRGPSQSHQDCTASPSADDGASCGTPDPGTVADSQCCCSSGRRPRGEQPLGLSGSGQDSAPSQDDAASPSRSGCTPDAWGNAPECTQTSGFVYVHPYTGEELVANCRVDSCSCEMAPCGEMEVFDLTVDKVAHYVTGSNSISRNCWVGVDELTQYETDYIYTYLFHRMRTANFGVPTRMRATGNPGGPGHNWVKERFIDPMPPGYPLRVTRKDGSTYHRVYIPSKLEDNKILMEADPGYGGRVYEISDPVMARAMREGDWNIAVGAAFPEFDPKIHVIDPAPMPTDKKILRALDWGYTDPYCGLWGFVNDGDLIIGMEAYGWSGKANVGTQEAPETVRHKLAGMERQNELYVPYGWLDSQCWDTNSGIGMIAAGLMGKPTDEDHMVWHPWKKGPNSRINQKQGVHEMMRVINGRSRLKIMRNCRHLIRTLPSVPRDKNNQEDVDTNSEDHAVDTLRAMIASGIPTREDIRRRTLRQYQESYQYVSAADLPGGGW